MEAQVRAHGAAIEEAEETRQEHCQYLHRVSIYAPAGNLARTFFSRKALPKTEISCFHDSFSGIWTRLPSCRTTFLVGESSRAKMTPVHSNATKIRYVDHATPVCVSNRSNISVSGKRTSGGGCLVVVGKVDGAPEQAPATAHRGPDAQVAVPVSNSLSRGNGSLTGLAYQGVGRRAWQSTRQRRGIRL